MRPPVSVVVPCYNEQAGLPALFARLDALLRDGGRGWRVLFGYRVRELPMRLGARRFGESKLKIGDAIVAHASLLVLAATLVATRRLRALVPGVSVMH